MDESSVADVVAYLAGGGGAAVMGKYLWDSMRRRKEELEAAAEARAEDAMRGVQARLDEVLRRLGVLETELRVASEATKAHEAVVREVKGRIDGMSDNYGKRLGLLEQRMSALEATAPRRRQR